jgi:uncharacterized protein YegL
MKPIYAHIALLLDRSGSMGSVRKATVDGLNTFIAKQREAPGEATVSLFQFDEPQWNGIEFATTFDMLRLPQVPILEEKDFVPRGNTPLTDAIAEVIDRTGRALSAMAEPDRPSRVYIVILTDGEENASRKTVMRRSDLQEASAIHWNGLHQTRTPVPDTRRVVSDLIEHQTSVYKWEFVFIGANQDAIKTGRALNIPMANSISVDHSDRGYAAVYASAAGNIRMARAENANLQAFTQQQRDDALTPKP